MTFLGGGDGGDNDEDDDDGVGSGAERQGNYVKEAIWDDNNSTHDNSRIEEEKLVISFDTEVDILKCPFKACTTPS